ncbi:WD40 repeat domain-containing protein [Crocosphaera sp.]|uniref:WD40 repeat domain-containing protein n=1 Tax=Crocosphaera sp. TaxID=2729996 RepID=UPI003F26F842|nr:hypothetical protein [Crocosphaera sp.]
MNNKSIEVTISTNYIDFKPGKNPETFQVSVVNLSDQFASFQVILQAAGTDEININDWYQLTPDIGQKIPPSGTAKFSVTLQKNPIPNFAGSLDILVTILSTELQNIEEKEFLRLTIEPGEDESSLRVRLPVKKFHIYPGKTIDIPCEIEQIGINSVNITATLTGLNSPWLIEEKIQRLSLPRKTKKELIFSCQLPSNNTVISQTYPFIIKVEQENVQAVEVAGSLEVFPLGKVIFKATPNSQQLPEKFPWFPHWKTSTVNYNLQFENQSNLKQLMSASLVQSDSFPQQWEMINKQMPIISLLVFKLFVKLWEKEPIAASLFLKENQFVKVNPNETRELDLKIHSVRPWVGRVKTLFFAVSAIASDTRLDVENSTELLQLKIYPKIPLWLGGLTGLLLLWVWYGLSCLNPYSPICGHQQAVNSVQFNGRGLNAISGSDDQTIIEWDLKGFGLKKLFTNPILSKRKTGKKDNDLLILVRRVRSLFNDQEKKKDNNLPKSVRVVRYKPLENNVVAVGLENGEVQVWDLLDDRNCLQYSFKQDANNRVLDIAFSQDSQFLYGSYGNGQIKQWKLNPNLNNSPNCNPITTTPNQEKMFDFAIYSVVFVGANRDFMVLGGQYNRLCLIDSNFTNEEKKCDDIGQTLGNDKHYIQSITTAQDKPNQIVTADNRGTIQVWDLSECLNKRENCQNLAPTDQWDGLAPRDQWKEKENPSQVYPVYSVALSRNGCYLVSGGQDGQVLLWEMSGNGTRSKAEYTKIHQSPKPINSVDIKVINQKIHILSGGDQTKVRLNVYTDKKLTTSECNN